MGLRDPLRRIALGTLCLWLAACQSTGPGPEYELDPDPIEGTNRVMLGFNDALDRWLLRPVAIGWTWITPEYFRTHLHQMYMNLNFPGQLVNNLLQAEVKQAGKDVGRFVTNSTVGIVGFFDPATGWGMPTRNEDFGQTLGVWGMGPGAYLMLPFAGPSGGRDFLAFPIDTVLNVGSSLALPGSMVRQINQRALALGQIEQGRAAALDWYSFVRNAYRTSREAAIVNEVGIAPDDDLYELDEDDE